jgi:ligand-binding SRPBCC domain-containing protein
MPLIVIETRIDAPASRCFDAARDMDLHARTMAHTRERAVAGVTTGLIGPGQSVTLEGIHLGIRQRLTARITQFDPPHCFIDEMTEGAFKSMRHTHEFLPLGQGTLMRDTVQWTSPRGILGRLADALFLKRYMRKLIAQRGSQLKQALETA